VSPPTIRTPENRAAVLAVLRLGHFREVAAQKAGISASALCRWIQDDDEFRAAVEGAEADEEIKLLAKVREGAREDPRLALALLERRFRARWSPRAAPASKDDGGSAGSGSGAREVPFGFEDEGGDHG